MKESKQVKKIVFPTDYHPVSLSDTDIDSSHAVEEQSSNNDNTKPSWKNEEEWFRTIIHRPSFIDHISLKKYLRCSDPIINKTRGALFINNTPRDHKRKPCVL